MFRASLPWLPLVLGCGQADLSAVDAAFISPAHGQTGVPAELPLRVAHFDLGLPADYGLGEPIRAVDLDRGGHVDGEIEIQQDGIAFVPSESWRPDTRYAWSYQPPTAVSHGPELSLGSAQAGVATFSTGLGLRVLEVVLTRPKRLCLVLSRPASSKEIDAIGVTMNEGCCLPEGEPIPVDLVRLPYDDWGDPLQLDPQDDPGVDVVCHYFDEGEFEPGSTLRIDVDGSTWWRGVPAGTLPDVFSELRRAECEPLAGCPPYPEASAQRQPASAGR